MPNKAPSLGELSRQRLRELFSGAFRITVSVLFYTNHFSKRFGGCGFFKFLFTALSPTRTMTNRKQASGYAAGAMLLWLCVYLAAVFCLPKWADMLFVLAAALPAFAVCKATPIFGSRDCNTTRYPKRAYALTAGFMISGCALLSFRGVRAVFRRKIFPST